jgi:phosphoglucomutase
MCVPKSVLTLPSYFHNGAQINTPMDVEIARSIEENLAPWPTAWDELCSNRNIKHDTYQDILRRYTNSITRYAVCDLDVTYFGN